MSEIWLQTEFEHARRLSKGRDDLYSPPSELNLTIRYHPISEYPWPEDDGTVLDVEGPPAVFLIHHEGVEDRMAIGCGVVHLSYRGDKPVRRIRYMDAEFRHYFDSNFQNYTGFQLLGEVSFIRVE